ncbi:MAG: hypothetical protein ABFD15_00255 [Methanofastidiosum sp.]
MKKIVAVLAGLLLLGSVFSIASVLALNITIDCYFDKTTVHPGEYITYTVKVCNNDTIPVGVDFFFTDRPPLEIVSGIE